MDKLPPHDKETEFALLGCFFLDPSIACQHAIGIVHSELFYDLRNAEIYKAITTCYENGKAIDLITVSSELNKLGKLDKIGGLSHLSELENFVSSVYNIDSYIEILSEKYRLRRIVRAGYKAVEDAMRGVDGNSIIEETCKTLNSFHGESVGKNDSIKDLVLESLDFFEACSKSDGSMIGLPTGFKKLDYMTGGLKPSEVFVIAARPSLGKTSIAMNIVTNVAVKQSRRVVVFSAEMSKESIIRRAICSEAGISQSRILKGNMQEEEFSVMAKAGSRIAASKIHLFDSRDSTIPRMKQKCRQIHAANPINLIVIDYLQILPTTGVKSFTRNNEIETFSREIKGIATELNVPVILLSQLNRDLEKDKHRKPRLSDLRDSGGIEQDADIVGLLYRTHPDGEASDSEQIEVNMLIAKQRNGPTGDVQLIFDKTTTTYTDREPKQKAWTEPD